MAAGEKRHQQVLDHLTLAHDHARKLRAQRGKHRAEFFRLERRVRHVF
jgi:hypothetical protein